MSVKISSARSVLAIAALLGLFSLVGCGGVRRVPVIGTVTLDGEPLPGGSLMLTPDGSKGNTARLTGTAVVKDGKYQASAIGVQPSETGSGLVLGWYKVTLNTRALGQPKVDAHPRFADLKETPLAIEVVENPQPGAYDLKLTRH